MSADTNKNDLALDAIDPHAIEEEAAKPTKYHEDVVHMPEELRAMSEEEIAALRKKMVRKMDCVIMPIIGILYILNYIDRQALAATKIYGIMDDLNMSEAQFATAISILFVGYLPFQIPSNMIMTIVPRPGLYLCIAATVWGVVSACTATVHSYNVLLAVRVFLGITEAVFFPGVIYYLSAWYDKNELGKRLALLFVFQMVGNAFGGFVAAACLTLDGAHGIAGWRWLFIVEGVVTVGCALIFIAIMPEYPHKARLLSPIEKKFAVWRLEIEAGAGEGSEDQSTLNSFKMAFLDCKIWALVWCMGMSQAMGSTNNFFPSIVNTLGFNKNITLLLTAPPNLLAGLVAYCVSYYSDRRNTIFPILCGALGFAVVAYAIPLATLSTAGRYVAMMIMPCVIAVPQTMIYKTMNLHMARPYPKRAAGVAMINSIGGISNIWASYLYYDSPRYTAAFGGALGFTTVFFITILAYKWNTGRLNRMLDGTPEEQAKVMKCGVTQQQIDLGWRYIGW